MNYDQNEYVTDLADAQAPLEEPESREITPGEFQAMLELWYMRNQAIKNVHTSWKKTTLVLDAICPEWRANDFR